MFFHWQKQALGRISLFKRKWLIYKEAKRDEINNFFGLMKKSSIWIEIVAVRTVIYRQGCAPSLFRGFWATHALQKSHDKATLLLTVLYHGGLGL